ASSVMRSCAALIDWLSARISSSMFARSASMCARKKMASDFLVIPFTPSLNAPDAHSVAFFPGHELPAMDAPPCMGGRTRLQSLVAGNEKAVSNLHGREGVSVWSTRPSCAASDFYVLLNLKHFSLLSCDKVIYAREKSPRQSL